MAVSLSFNFFFPTLAADMGFSDAIALLLCAPPWVFATVCSFVVARFVLIMIFASKDRADG